MNHLCSEADRVVPNAISAPPAFSLRRAFAAVCALVAATVAQATPTISITTSVASPINVTNTPTVTITATPTIGSSPSGTQVSKVEFFVNSVSIGTVGGGAFNIPYSTTWTPSSTGSYRHLDGHHRHIS